ncbi:MFS transporter [Caulobacter segnis]|uniref:Major facilitator superfamily MFS_1 n=2 Tax=Caulobacter segnis TaxID=88688 RepID=D5VLU4_CAUST|nr:MFS transporter [Caulobacter segnis]ADG11467.1 major facilitator superfamily MFS_1 [Caulobacter segnis ATCC 21756]AVQ03128.1 MFS transporter [Caulobacter segnis]
MGMRLLDRAQEAADDDHWIGRPPSGPQIAAYLTVGTVALMFAGVQPILLDALVAERRLTAGLVGWSFTVEFLTLALGVVLSGAVIRPDKLPLKGLLAGLTLAILNAAMLHASGPLVLADRAAAGLVEGVLVWLTMLMITRASTPARWAGVFLVAQGLLQVSFAAILPATLMDRFGANGGFAAAAAVALIGALAAFALPRAAAPLPTEGETETGGARGHGARAIASLAAVFLTYAFFIGFFAYLPQLAGQAKMTPGAVGGAVSLSLALSILGSGVAALVAKRLSYYSACLTSVAAFAVVLVWIWKLPAAPVFMVLASLHGFFWGFFMPFQMPLVIESDPTRRAAALVPTVQALGAAAGPVLCSLWVTEAEARGGLLAAGACLALALLIVTVLHIQRLSTSPLGLMSSSDLS